MEDLFRRTPYIPRHAGIAVYRQTALNYANLLGYQESLSLKGQQFNYLSASTVLFFRMIRLKNENLTYSSGLCRLLFLVNIRVDGLLENFLPACIVSKLHDVGFYGYYHDSMS